MDATAATAVTSKSAKICGSWPASWKGRCGDLFQCRYDGSVLADPRDRTVRGVEDMVLRGCSTPNFVADCGEEHPLQ